MEINDYQDRAMKTCMSTCENDAYMLSNLVGEVGEFSSKIAKAIRKGWMDFTPQNNLLFNGATDTEREELLAGLMGEAGDILWQLAGLCYTFGWTLEEVAQANLDKLASRAQRGVIDGSGDNR